jgi:hypothetical protein
MFWRSCDRDGRIGEPLMLERMWAELPAPQGHLGFGGPIQLQAS